MKAHLIILLVGLTFISSLNFLSIDEENESLSEFPDIPGLKSIHQFAQKAFDLYNSTDYNTSAVKQKIEEIGFDYFKGRCVIENTRGVRKDDFPFARFTKRLLDRVNVPEPRIEEIFGKMGNIRSEDKDIDFKLYNILFNKETIENKNINFMVIFTFFNERMNLDYVHATLKIDFEFAKDLLIVNEFLSKKTESSPMNTVINRLPEDVNKEELKVMAAYFELVILYQLGTGYGLEMPKPIPVPKPVPQPVDPKTPKKK